MQTQSQKILNRIKKVGYIDNFWCIKNYILRLGARIHDLREEGYNFEGKDGRELKKKRSLHKNFYYFIKDVQSIVSITIDCTCIIR